MTPSLFSCSGRDPEDALAEDAGSSNPRGALRDEQLREAAEAITRQDQHLSATDPARASVALLPFRLQ